MAAPRAPKTDLALLDPTAVSTFVVPADPESGTPERTFTIGKFKFIKSLLVMETLGELARRVDVGSIFTGRTIEIDLLIDKLPVLLMTMRPAITKALALTLLSNKALQALAEDEASLEAALAEHRQVVNGLDLPQVAELLGIAIERIGIQDIKETFPKLLGALTS